ncbi:MAG TPA: hypothetical protein VG899_10520 [Mycobacteriales bacterium]|nr:hypothetical protein [Mycobacteriales bacterium]
MRLATKQSRSGGSAPRETEPARSVRKAIVERRDLTGSCFGGQQDTTVGKPKARLRSQLRKPNGRIIAERNAE